MNEKRRPPGRPNADTTKATIERNDTAELAWTAAETAMLAEIKAHRAALFAELGLVESERLAPDEARRLGAFESMLIRRDREIANGTAARKIEAVQAMAMRHAQELHERAAEEERRRFGRAA